MTVLFLTFSRPLHVKQLQTFGKLSPSSSQPQIWYKKIVFCAKSINKVLYVTKSGSWRTSYGLQFFSPWVMPLLFTSLEVCKEYFKEYFQYRDHPVGKPWHFSKIPSPLKKGLIIGQLDTFAMNLVTFLPPKLIQCVIAIDLDKAPILQ